MQLVAQRKGLALQQQVPTVIQKILLGQRRQWGQAEAVEAAESNSNQHKIHQG